MILTRPCEQRLSMGSQKEGIRRSTTCVYNGNLSDWMIKCQHNSIRIYQMLNRVKLIFSWAVLRSRLRKRYVYNSYWALIKELPRECQTINCRLSITRENRLLYGTKLSIRMVSASRLEEFCVDYKINNNIHIIFI